MPTKSTSKTPSTTSHKLAPGGLADLRQPPPHPGAVFRLDVREPIGLSQAEAARRLGISTNYMNQIELGKSPVSAEMAVKLEALTGASAEMWGGLQLRYDLWHALRAVAPIPGPTLAAVPPAPRPVLLEPATDRQVRELRRATVAAGGDPNTVDLCDRALAGSARARRMCTRMIAEAKAQMG